MSFMLIGLMVKSAVFPMHLWLPPAYSYAPSAVSTLFAALATKAILIFFVRILYEVLIPTVRMGSNDHPLEPRP